MDVSNVEFGVCDVLVGGTSIGHTSGGAKFSYEPTVEDIVVDQYGETPVDKVVVGETVMITVQFAESTQANFNRAMPATTITNDGIAGGSNAGTRLSANAVELTLHPIEMGSDTSKDIKIYKAVVQSSLEVDFKNEERIFEVEFVALIDETKDEGNRLFEFYEITA